MARKTNQRQVRNRSATGKARNRARPAREATSPPLPANGSVPVGGASNGVPAEAATDPLNQVTTYVYDGRNRVTRVYDPSDPLCSFILGVNQPAEEPKRSARKRQNPKTRKQRTTTKQRKPG
jgi:YD repeat-containing protein